MAFFSRVAGS